MTTLWSAVFGFCLLMHGVYSEPFGDDSLFMSDPYFDGYRDYEPDTYDPYFDGYRDNEPDTNGDDRSIFDPDLSGSGDYRSRSDSDFFASGSADGDKIATPATTTEWDDTTAPEDRTTKKPTKAPPTPKSDHCPLDEEDEWNPMKEIDSWLDTKNEKECTYTCKQNRSVCTYLSKFCDGKTDCPGNEDEENCNGPSCPAFTFKCPNEDRCVSGNEFCDGTKHCRDGFDEYHKQCKCMMDSFWCPRRGHCMKKYFYCDGKVDCEGVDEIDCPSDTNFTETCSKQPNSKGYIEGSSVTCLCMIPKYRGQKVGEMKFMWWLSKGHTHIGFVEKPDFNAHTITHRPYDEGVRYFCEMHDLHYFMWDKITYVDVRFAFFKSNSVKLEVSPREVKLCKKPSYFIGVEVPLDVEGDNYGEVSSSGDREGTSGGDSEGTPGGDGGEPLSIATRDAGERSVNSDTLVKVTCQVSRTCVNPAPMFSFSVSGGEYDTPVEGIKERDYFVRRKEVDFRTGGQHSIKCRVTNTILEHLQQEAETFVEVQEPPTGYPTLTVFGQTFQGTNDDIHTGIVSARTNLDSYCSVNGGYPAASITDGCRVIPQKAGPSVTRYECTCEAKHPSGCYEHTTTSVKYDITIQSE